MNELLVDIAINLIKIAFALAAVVLMIPVMVYAERRLSAVMQYRLGPNRVGPFGLLQPIADAIKFFFKEDVIPREVDRSIYVLAPIIIMIPVLLMVAVIPFGDTITLFGRTITLQVIDLNVGLLYVFAMASLTVYGLVLAGWASNNKYSQMGGLRASAQLISYELSLGLSTVGVLLITGSLRLSEVVNHQVVHGWNILYQPLGFLLFLVAAFAETNRLPFDLTEAEQELVGGYHTEYSSMKFSMFFMAEYASMVIGSAMLVTLFLGGWHLPGLTALGLPDLAESILQVLFFGLKVAFFLFFFIWVRWTLPRFRYDQLMGLGWKVLLPAALINLFVTALVMAFL